MLLKLSCRILYQRKLLAELVVASLCSIEDHRFVTIHEDPPLRPPLDSCSQDLAFDIAALVDKLFSCHAMVDAGDSLFDDGTFVEVCRYKVSRGSNDLDAPVKGLVIRLGTLEGWQEAVMDIDDLAGHGFAESWREHLHVSSKHHQLDVVLFDKFEYSSFLVGLSVFRDREMVENNVVALGQGLEVWMIANNHGYVHSQLARLLAKKEVVETVADL